MPLLSKYLQLNTVNLLAGKRDAGKTRWIIPSMMEWKGRTGWAYVAADRSLQDAVKTITDMGFRLTDVPLVEAYGSKHISDWKRFVERELVPLKPEIVVIEAFQYLCENFNRHRIVDTFMHEMGAYCERSNQFPDGLTIIGLCGGSKKALSEQYPDPTQRVPGAATWVERASTVFVIEGGKGKDNLDLLKPYRFIYACPKSGNPRTGMYGDYDALNRLRFPATSAVPGVKFEEGALNDALPDFSKL